MGKGTKKKTVWRTFSFENGYTNGNDATATATNNGATATATATTAVHITNGFNVPHHHQQRQHHKQKYENGNNDITNHSSITNGKFISNWRIKRCPPDDNDDDDDDVENKNVNGDATANGNDTEIKLNHHTNGHGINGYAMDNGGHRSYFKRSSYSESNRYPWRVNGLRKSSAYFQENGGGVGGGGGGGGGGGTRSDFHDIYGNSTHQHSQFRSSRLSKGPPTSRYANYRKWDSRNGSFSLNGTAPSNYSRGFRKSHFIHSDEATTAAAAASTMVTDPQLQQQQPIATAITTSNEFINHTDEHFREAKNARNAGDSDKCHDNASNGDGNSSQQLYDQTDKRRGKQQNKFNEDEYTRISTPRSEVLFKKGYLMRDKKHVGPTNMMSAAGATTSSSNDSGSVSVISNEETASYYSIQSMSPDDSNSTYMNGGGGHSSSTDSNSATYPNDGFEHDLSLIYSSGFYDNSGYFYVNPYIHNNFDQFNGPTILMPYGNAPTTTTPTPTTKDTDAYDTDAYPQTSLSPGTGDGKSVDSEQANNFSSINSEEMSNSSLSINNDSDTPPNPLTPPPSPLSPNEEPISRAIESETGNSEKSHEENEVKPENADDSGINSTAEAPDGENVTEPTADVELGDVPDADAIVSTDNYSMPYFSPLIFVPPIPFVPDARMGNSRRGKFRRHLGNQYGRMKRNNRFPHFYNKVYIPSNWSEAPDEAALSNTNADSTTELNDEKPADGTPTIEQCDKILKNSKLNLNVSEFIPQSKRMIFVPLSIASSPPASLYFVPIPSTESTLNVNVPEFLPKNYKPLNERTEEKESCAPISTADATNDDDKTNDDEGEHGDDANNNSNKMNRNGEAKTSSTTHHGGGGGGDDDDEAKILTNESAKNQNNETTINHKDDLSNDTAKGTEYTTPNTKQMATTTKMTTAAIVAAAAAATTTNGAQHSHAMTTRKTNVPNKQNGGVSVPTLSDLLKTNNSDNLNLNAAAFNFNKETNSHTNSKADLGNKKITYNNSKKVYKTDNQLSDSGSSKNHMSNSNNNSRNNNANTNRNAKTRHAYPKTKETSYKQQQEQHKHQQQDEKPEQQRTVADDESVTKEDRPVNGVSNQKLQSENVSKSEEKSSRTYAQMVVPAAAAAATATKLPPATLMKMPPKTTENKTQANGTARTLKSPSKSSTPSSPKDKSASPNVNRNKTIHLSKKRNNNYNNSSNNTAKDDTKRKPDMPEKPVIDGSIEWFTVDSKGKKHAAPNGSPITEIAFENIESNEEKVSKIAEELLLDINKDADLAMDIMDSLTVNTDEKPPANETKAKVVKKKKSTPSTNKLKKKSKEKPNKEQQKRRETFDIIEPNFGAKKPTESESELEANEVENNTLTNGMENDEHEISTDCNELNESLFNDKEDGDADDDDAELIFDPNVFATPCNLQMDSHQLSPSIGGPASLSKSLRLSAGGKSVRNLINQFDIYQPDFTSYESQQLKQEEEMVIKVLQQLNNNNNHILSKSTGGVELMDSSKMMVHAVAEAQAHATSSDKMPVSNDIIVSNELCDELLSMREDSVERFAINAKPYQNVYSSNHFLEHFFGDRDDKCDHVVDSDPSTDLSSSNQTEYVDEHNEEDAAVSVEENFNTYPAICTDENVESNSQNGDSIENECVEDEQHESEQHDLSAEVQQPMDSDGEQMPTDEKVDTESETEIDIQQPIECESEHSNVDLEMEPPTSENVCESMQEIHTELSSDIEFIQTPQTESQNEAFQTENDCIGSESSEAAEPIRSEPNDMANDQKCNVDTMPEATAEKCDGTESISIVASIESDSIEPPEQSDAEPIISCNQSVKSNASSNERPWLRIVDTHTLEQEKKVQQTFPITSAVSMWLQAQKEKTPEPVLRIPNYRRLLTAAAAAASTSSSSSIAGTKRTKIDSQTSHSNSSIDLTEDTASLTSDKFHDDDDDDEEEDIMNFWESPLLSPQSPTPPPIYQSVYGTSINYTNLLSNKNELLCNNIVDFDRIDATDAATATAANGKPNETNINKLKNGFNQNAAAAAAAVAAAPDTMTNGKIGNGTDDQSYRPPHHEVCCTVM